MISACFVYKAKVVQINPEKVKFSVSHIMIHDLKR